MSLTAPNRVNCAPKSSLNGDRKQFAKRFMRGYFRVKSLGYFLLFVLSRLMELKKKVCASWKSGFWINKRLDLHIDLVTPLELNCWMGEIGEFFINCVTCISKFLNFLCANIFCMRNVIFLTFSYLFEVLPNVLKNPDII